MKKILIICIFFKLFVPLVFSQDGEYAYGGRFSKLIEYNRHYLGELGYNIDSKIDVEKKFWGKYNAPIEFLYIHPFEGHSGFRILRDSVKSSYSLEVKYISNYKEAWQAASEKYPLSTPVSLTELAPSNRQRQISDDEQKLPDKQREDKRAKHREEFNRLYVIDSLSLPVSDRLAEKLYNKTVLLIDRFKARGLPPIMHDAHNVTFRTVVDDELWTLKIRIPSWMLKTDKSKGNAFSMADIYRQIIEDVKDNKFDEAKYIQLLDEL
jgi:hypothetical protein